MIQAYRRERAEDPRGLTASGLGVYIREHGVLLQKGFLGSKFLDGTPFELTPDGLLIRPI
jgi:hypothetical protein